MALIGIPMSQFPVAISGEERRRDREGDRWGSGNFSPSYARGGFGAPPNPLQFLIPPGLPGSAIQLPGMPGSGGGGGFPGMPGLPGGLAELLKDAAKRLGHPDPDGSPLEELLEWIRGEGADGLAELAHVDQANKADKQGRNRPPPPRHKPGRKPHRPPPRHGRGDPRHPDPAHRPPRGHDPRRPGGDPRHPDPAHRPDRKGGGDPRRPGGDPRHPDPAHRPDDPHRPPPRGDMGDIASSLGVFPLLALIPVVIGALAPWIQKAAEGLGHKGTDATGATRALIGGGDEGRRRLRAALRAGKKAHEEGRADLPQEAVDALSQMDLGDHGTDYGHSVPSLPVATRLLGAPSPAAHAPSSLPSVRELAQKGARATQAQVQSGVQSLVALRSKLVSLRAMEGRLSSSGRASLARAIALYSLATRLLSPVRAYLEKVVPGAGVLFDSSLGVIPAAPVLIGVAIAVAGGALIAVAAVVAAAWSEARAAEASAAEATSSRQAATDATTELVRIGVEAAPSYTPQLVSRGLDTLVTSSTAAEEARAATPPGGASGEILGLPWWVVAAGAALFLSR